MRNYGYKAVSLKNVNLTSAEAQTVNGIFESLETTYSKPILLTDIIIDGVEKNATFIELIPSSGNLTFTIYGRNITVTEDDSVSINAQS